MPKLDGTINYGGKIKISALDSEPLKKTVTSNVNTNFDPLKLKDHSSNGNE